jgi:16S rRNA (guanine527-N7)-methyltransferase
MGSFDIVTARALTHLSRLLHMADPFLKKTGRLIAMKGPDAESEIKETAEEMDKTGFVVESISKLRLPESGAERKLIVLQRHPSC